MVAFKVCVLVLGCMMVYAQASGPYGFGPHGGFYGGVGYGAYPYYAEGLHGHEGYHGDHHGLGYDYHDGVYGHGPHGYDHGNGYGYGGYPYGHYGY